MMELAPGFVRRRDPKTDQEYLEVPIQGEMLNDFSMFNKGTAFTQEERDSLKLHGLLPPRIVTMTQHTQRVMENYRRKTTDLERYVNLISLLDRNETLFYRIIVDHLEEMLPIIYTPTVGQACQQFGHIYRRNRGIYLTPEDVNRVDEILANWPFHNVGIIVVTDGERILGLGDLGAGGMGIAIGKLSLYIAGAGIHPARTLPVCLDVGTNNEALLNDPLYLGKIRKRVRGPEYDNLVEAFVQGVQRRFPKAIIQFEDFGITNAFRLLGKYRDRARCFNDDIQGTGAVTRAGILSALRLTGGTLEKQKIIISGAGSGGVGIAYALKEANIWLFDSKGLCTKARTNQRDFQGDFLRDEPTGDLLEVAKRVRPNIIIGVAGKPGLFTKELIETMEGPRPIVFPLSNPTANSECTPAQVREWTNGRGIVATGSPFPETAQCNNMYIFPGVGLGVICADASRVTDKMFRVAAQTLSSMAPAGQIFRPLREIRQISAAIAFEVAKEAFSAGLAKPCSDSELRARIAEEQWEPGYIPYRPAKHAMTRDETLHHSD